MEYLYDNIIRGAVTNLFVLLHMFIVGEAKYGKKITTIAFTALYLLLTSITICMYYFIDITTFSKYSAIVWIFCGIACKFLFADSVMKWMFNIITVINVFIFVVIISYTFADTNSEIIIIRVVLYTIIIFVFKKYLRTLYRQVVDRWHLFLAASVAVLLNFLYPIITARDIQVMLTEDIISLLLMVLAMLLIYVTIFWSLSSIIKEYEYRSENQQAKLSESLLSAQLNSYEEFVEASKRHRHDLRHHNQIIMEYLKGGDIDGAEEYLKLYDTSINQSVIKQYCKNYIANAVLCLYAQKAHLEEIVFEANAYIPEIITITQPELGSMLSNILENALEACRKAKGAERFITFTAEFEDDMLKIELRNTTSGELHIRNNLPVSTKKNGGTGTKSVLHIVESYHGMLNFRQEDETFITQIILPT